jgi:hypothetical protein
MICAFFGCVRGVGIMKESMDPSRRYYYYGGKAVMVRYACFAIWKFGT